MESKIIKIRTNGDILRDAYIISGFVIDGSEYVVYYADRDDGESDNIFVSKLIKNTDGTYNMLDIENVNEKTGVSNVVKELIVAAVKDNEHDTLDSDTYTLSDGRVVNIFSLMINKEQTVDIQKTYISSVKKAVSEVTRKYFDIKIQTSASDENYADTLFTDIPVQTVTEVAPIIHETPVEPVVTPVATETVSAAVEPVLPEIPVQETKIEEVVPVLEVPAELITPAPSEVIPVVEPVQEVKPIVVEPIPTPVTSVSPTPIAPAVGEPVNAAPETLVLDATKETNLNSALGEAGNEGLAVDNINAIKDFGVEESVVSSSSQVNQNTLPINTSKAGFANNKFFVFLAVAFFVGSCVFLGYEVFNYFQILE